MTPEIYHALPALGSGDLNAYFKGGPESLGRRQWLRTKDAARSAGLAFLPGAMTADQRAYDLVAEEERLVASRAMRFGSLFEAYVFAGPMLEEIDWAERGSSWRDRDRAMAAATKALRRPQHFPALTGILGLRASGQVETQVDLVAELRPGVWCKGRLDFLWVDDEAVAVEADLKTWAGWPSWRNEEDVLKLAGRRGALRQRALYRLLHRSVRGQDCRSALLVVDPLRRLDDGIVPDPEKPFQKTFDLLVEIPETHMTAAEREVDEALDSLALAKEKVA